MSDKPKATNEAIEKVLQDAERIAATAMSEEYWRKVFDMMIEAMTTVPRNSDVGTADEQLKRYNEFCAKMKNCCGASSISCYECYGRWLRMPYKEESK